MPGPVVVANMLRAIVAAQLPEVVRLVGGRCALTCSAGSPRGPAPRRRRARRGSAPPRWRGGRALALRPEARTAWRSSPDEPGRARTMRSTVTPGAPLARARQAPRPEPSGAKLTRSTSLPGAQVKHVFVGTVPLAIAKSPTI